MDALTWFGLFAVTAMLICYALQARSPRFILIPPYAVGSTENRSPGRRSPS
jgi:hypothetical protein